jgi:hypothetical protein
MATLFQTEVLTHILIQDWFQRSVGAHANEAAQALAGRACLPLKSRKRMLLTLRQWIATLVPKNRESTAELTAGHFSRLPSRIRATAPLVERRGGQGMPLVSSRPATDLVSSSIVLDARVFFQPLSS